MSCEACGVDSPHGSSVSVLTYKTTRGSLALCKRCLSDLSDYSDLREVNALTALVQAQEEALGYSARTVPLPVELLDRIAKLKGGA